MAESSPVHEFDESRASRFEPNRDYVKTAILLQLAAEDAVTVIRTSFGEQTFRGSFYVVADGEGSYGAAPSEFEAVHEETAPNRWAKTTPVSAYIAGERCRVRTYIDGRIETTVTARPEDWIVRQGTGEIMVLEPAEFARRYETNFAQEGS